LKSELSIENCVEVLSQTRASGVDYSREIAFIAKNFISVNNKERLDDCDQNSIIEDSSWGIEMKIHFLFSFVTSLKAIRLELL
jgi:hypothetical protein